MIDDDLTKRRAAHCPAATASPSMHNFVILFANAVVQRARVIHTPTFSETMDELTKLFLPGDLSEQQH